MLRPFRVHVIFHVKSQELHAKLKSAGAHHLPDAPVIDNCGNFSYYISVIDQSSEVMAELERVRARRKAIVIVSDCLTEPTSDGYKASDFAIQCRDWFNDSEDCVSGLIALVDGPKTRTADITGMVDVRKDDDLAAAIRQETRRVSDGIWLKSKVRLPDDRSKEDAIQIRLATEEDELRQAFGLRFAMYNALGYLEPDVAENPSRMEVDSFDSKALHFVAVDENAGVVGTVRLITNANPPQRAVYNTVGDIIEKQQSILAEIVSGVRILQEKAHAYTTAPYPILHNSDFGDRWSEFLSKYPPDDGGELSRLVVAPRFRSLGISTLLVRMVSALAIDLGKKYIILECVPQHVSMYQRHHYEPVPEHHCRAQDLDQYAVGMHLNLQGSQYNRTCALAANDLNMLQHVEQHSNEPGQKPFLCMCHVSNCWKFGHYEQRGRTICPLQHVLQPATRVV